MDDIFRSVWWDDGAVGLLDQRLLPTQEVTVRCTTLEDVGQAIRTMQVRGAPAIGCTAAYGMALVAHQQADSFSSNTDAAHLLARLSQAKQFLDAQRPTAVNLAWATRRVFAAATHYVEAATTPPTHTAIAARVLQEAQGIFDQDLEMCLAIGRHGAAIIPERGNVLTHCNAGGLATAGYGTALAPIRIAHEQGRPVHVFVDETRPFMQGARLTAWELQRAEVPLTLITDNMAGYFMRRGEVDCIIVGADRIVANGDVANKIGTYSLAVLARAHDIPFYVAAPSSTVDMTLSDGDAIPIEQRASSEVTTLNGVSIAPAGVTAAHPAFDVTPHTLITAIITERGVLYPPFNEKLQLLVMESQTSEAEGNKGQASER